MAFKARHARRLNEVRDALAEALQARNDAIAAAWRDGAGLREIAREVGISHVAVRKLLARTGVREPEDTKEREERRGHWYG